MTITIITTTYNSAATLRDTFESVLRQTHQDVDYIVVDGASTDGTIGIIRDYEPRFNGRMHWLSERDKSLYDAMNKGLAMAKGKVIGFLNSDDFYTSTHVLERVANVIGEEQVQAVYGDIHYARPTDLKRCVRYYSSRFFRPSWMRLGFMPAHPSFYCRREVYEQCGHFDISYKIASDFEFLLRALYIHRVSARYIPMDFVTMRTGGTSNSGMQSHRQIMRDHLKALHVNHVWSCLPLLCLRYVYKVGEILVSRIFPHKVRAGEAQ